MTDREFTHAAAEASSASLSREFTKPFLTPKERRQYNFRRAVLCSEPSGQARACFEREISDEYRRRTRQPASTGITIPAEIVWGPDGFESRALSATTFAAGGAAIGEEAAPLVSFLHPQSVVLQLGARLVGGITGSTEMPDLRGALRIPLGTANDEAQWLAEGELPSDQASTFGAALASPKRVFAQRRLSRQLLLQTSQNEALPETLIMGAFAAALDRAALAGTGGKQPLGLLHNPDVPAVALGAIGAEPTLAALNSAEGKVITAKVPLTTPGWVLSPKAREKMKATPKVPGFPVFLLETIADRDRCNGFTSFATAYLPDDGAKGSGSSLGSAIFGAWEWLIFVGWGGLDVVADPYTYAAASDVLVSVNGYADAITPRPYAFTRISDIVTT